MGLRPRRGRLVNRLLAATLLPTVAVLGGFGFWAHDVARRSLEDELSRGLAASAAAVALVIVPSQISAIGPGDEESNTYRNLVRRLQTAREETGLRRVFLVASDLSGRGDSDGRVALGAPAYELGADRVEIDRSAQGQPSASPLFWGHDGRPYKRAYARVGRPAVGFVVVEGSADYFAALARFRHWLLLAGGMGLGALIALIVVMARRITGPLDRLTVAADRMGQGELGTPISSEGSDEVALLAGHLDEMRAALAARDERLQMMLAGIAHEVRNPLGGLELYAGLLREGLPDQPDRLAEVARIEREIGHLKGVVTEFLEYARRPPLQTATVALAPLFAEVKELCQDKATLQIQVAGDTVVQGDRVQLRRALVNLTRNAVAAAGPGGLVVLTASPFAGTTVRCEVRDSGSGVPVALRDKVFTPFFTTREKGTGLGLAFVREIVRSHGGDVVVDEAPEGGARFAFTLPVG